MENNRTPKQIIWRTSLGRSEVCKATEDIARNHNRPHGQMIN